MAFQGKLLIFSAPSGSGKTTIVQHLVGKYENLGFSVSACTRPKRGRTEIEGVHYYFFSKEEFEEKIHNNEFVEYEQVYQGAYYGTLKTEIERLWAQGKHVVFDVDVKGGLKLKEYYEERALAVFVKIPSIEILRKRLEERNTESDASIETRMSKAEYEMSFESEFDVILVNETLADTLKKAEEIIEAFVK